MKGKTEEKDIFILTVITSLVGLLAMALRTILVGYPWYGFLAWNLFLSVIPLMAALVLSHFGGRARSKWWIVLGAFWLLFYPNAPYMVTDLIHVPKSVFIAEFRSPVRLKDWGDTLIIGYFSVLGFGMGLESLKRVYWLVEYKFGMAYAVVLVAIVQFLSSLAIYVGRFWRINSWDIWNPKIILDAFLDSITGKGLVFSLMFWTFLSVTYALYAMGSSYGVQATSKRYSTGHLWLK